MCGQQTSGTHHDTISYHAAPGSVLLIAKQFSRVCFSGVLHVGLPLPDLLAINYNLAELDIVEVREGLGEAMPINTLANGRSGRARLWPTGGEEWEKGKAITVISPVPEQWPWPGLHRSILHLTTLLL